MTTLIDWLAPHLRADNSAPAQRFQGAEGWESRTYGELHALVGAVANRLLARGVTSGRPVAILAHTSPAWSALDLAAALIGAVIVPIYPTASDAQVRELVRRSAPALIVSDRDLDDLGVAQVALDEITAPGAEAWPASVVAEHQPYSIVFSSGSTGEPKGCVITHANMVATLRGAAALESGGPQGAAHRAHAFVYLPLAHVSARLQQLTTFSLGGELIYGSGDTATLLEQITETRPTYVPGVPRLFESALMRVERSPERLREVFGDRLHYALTGGAPIDPELLAAYAAAGVPLVEGYGLTESAAALTLSAPHANRPGSVGRALPGVELRIATDGEIQARGANIFAGYLDDPERTAEAFADGWLRTGDLGRIDEDGYVFVTGRTKNLIVTSTGKNVAPEPLENRLRAGLGVDAVVVGDRRPFLSALVFSADAMPADVVREVVQQMNADHAPPECVRTVVVVPRALDTTDGHLTASGKVVRTAVIDAHAATLDALYAGADLGDLTVIPVPLTTTR